MTTNDPTDPETADTGDQQPSVARKNRGVRFSDPEWEEVRQAAQALGITPAEFVRERILDLVRSLAAPASAPIPANLTPLIERTFRCTYMHSTKMRAEMNDNEQGEQLDHLINEARELRDALLAKPSNSGHKESGRVQTHRPPY